jgi:beta-galactosidase
MRAPVAALAALLLATAAPALADKPTSQPIAFGTAWYPEQWPESRWETDLALMERAHINTVRIAEFAWSTMEPEEGRFEFGWLDRAIAAAARHHIRVVLGTPTAAPPIWMTERYPDILRVDEDGTRAGHGGRRHFSFASARYRQFARRIASEMAKRYGHNPDVIGWQIDNEIGLPSFDPEAVTLWHTFLAKKYGTVAELNRRWATAYWSQTYQRFDQVPLHATGQQNPGLLLDFRHFATATWTSYVMNQADAIRAAADPRQFITTNTMFWNDGFDHFQLHQGLDIAAWDNYIQDATPDWVANGADHDLVRGYKQKNFWLMETQAGRIDWVPVNRALRPGQVREMGWQAVQHGADAVLYWEFRPAPNGQETNYGTLLAPDGTPAPIFSEIAGLGDEFAKSSATLADTQPAADVAFLFSYDSRWAIDLQRMHKDFDPIREFTDFYRPFRVAAQGAAVVSPLADLSRYKLVVAPSLNVLTATEAKRLADYVRAGGTLILGPRTGQKDDANALWDARQPGPLRDLLGAHVDQFYVQDGSVALTGALGDGTASIWAEALVPDTKDVEVLASYRDPGGWLDGKATVVTRAVGKGRIAYVGAWLDPAEMAALAHNMLTRVGVKPLVANAAPDLEIGARDAADHRVLIAINHGDQPAPLTPPAGASLTVGNYADGRIPGHGVAVFTIPR